MELVQSYNQIKQADQDALQKMKFVDTIKQYIET